MNLNNPDPLLIAVARFTRDLLSYDEELISIGRNNDKLENATDNRIAIDSTSPSSRLSSSTNFDGDEEKMHLSAKMQKPVVLSFYGLNAYDVADDFILMQKSQLSYDLQNEYGISVYLISSVLDVKQLTGSSYINRLDVSINVVYNKSKIIDTLRIDESQLSLISDT